MYKVGMNVRINAEGHERYGYDRRNPEGVTGKVTEDTNSDGWCHVEWSDGYTNEYEDDTLDVVDGE